MFIDEMLVSVISVFINDGQARFRKFATLQEYQNKGYGSILFQHMLKKAIEYKINRIWCDARLDVIKFYSRFDFICSSDNVFYKGNICYTVMEKIL